jgi:hypothetical protein
VTVDNAVQGCVSPLVHRLTFVVRVGVDLDGDASVEGLPETWVVVVPVRVGGLIGARAGLALVVLFLVLVIVVRVVIASRRLCRRGMPRLGAGDLAEAHLGQGCHQADVGPLGGRLVKVYTACFRT